MNRLLISSLTLLVSACAAATAKPGSDGLPSQDGFRYHAEVSSVPDGASTLHVQLRLPDDSILPISGSALVGNAPLTILYPPESRAEPSAEHSGMLTIGPARVSWTKKVEAEGSHMELDIETRARPMELTLNLVARPGSTVDADTLRKALDHGFTVLADGKPIEAGATRLERTPAVAVASTSAPR